MSEFPREVVEERLSPLRDTLVVDGYDLVVEEVEDGRVSVRVIATADACDDCLVPKMTMVALFRQAILDGADEDLEIDVRYPAD